MIAKVIYRMMLQGRRRGSLLKDICAYHIISPIQYPRKRRRRTEESSVCCVRMDTVNYRERKFTFGEIFGEALVCRVLGLDET